MNTYNEQRAAHIKHLDTLQMALLNAKALGDRAKIKRLGVQIGQVQLILRREFPKRRHDPTTLPDYFLIACKDRLPPEQFAGLIDVAERLQATAGRAAA